MWPLLLDLTKDECKRMLRRLELEAYSSIVSAFRAQGDLTKDKKKLLQDLTGHLGISTERHRAEIRRAVNDEKLATIADQVAGSSIASEWTIEGRRLVPLMPRLVPQTAFTSIANNAANVAATQNASLPLPKDTCSKLAENVPVSQGNAEGASTKPATKAIAQQSMKQSTSQSIQTSPVQIQYETQLLKSGSLSTATEDIQNSHPVQSSQMLVSAAVQTLEPSSMNNSNNVVMLPGGMSIHLKDNSLDCDKSRRRKRSPSADLSPTVGKTSTPLPLSSISGMSSAIAKVRDLKVSTSSQRTVSIPIGGTPVQFTFTGTGQKTATTLSANSTSATGQKVIFVSSSCASSLPSSILQRSLSVPVVKTVAATGCTVSLSPAHSKPTSLIAPSATVNATCEVSSGSTSELSSQSSFISTVSPTANKTNSIVSQPTISSTSQIPAAVRQVMKQGILVPVGTQPSSDISSASQTLQLKPGSMITKPPTFHIKEGSGLKIIAQTLPFAGSAKILPKPSGHGTNIPPILVVKKNTSLPSSFHPSARVVNVITTQSSTGKVISASPLSAVKSGATPTLVTVGQKGKQAAVVKVSPSMALTSTGGKSNVFVVQKTHMLPSSQAGGTIAVTTAPLSSVSRSLSTAGSGSGMVNQGDKDSVPIEHKSTVLADILQAAGILPEMIPEGHSSELSEHVTSSTVEKKEIPQCQFSSDVSSDTSLTVEEWMSMGDEVKVSQLSQQICPEPQSKSSSKRLERSPSVRIQQISLPFELQEGQILEIQDASALVAQSNKFSTETIDLLRRAGFDLPSDLAASTTSSNSHNGSHNLEKEGSSETLTIQDTQVVEALESTSIVSDVSNGTLSSAVSSIINPLTEAKLESCQEEIISESTEESGELDPKTGIFYPYARTDKTSSFSDGSHHTDEGQNNNSEQNTPNMWGIDNASQQMLEYFPQSLSSNKNQTAMLIQSTAPETNTNEISKSGDEAVCAENTVDTGNKHVDLESNSNSVSATECRDTTPVADVDITENLLTTEITFNEQVQLKTKDDVEMPPSPCNKKMLYCGATYSKEAATSKQRTSQTETALPELDTKNDQEIEVDKVPSDLLNSNVSVNLMEDNIEASSVAIVQEVLECEEIPFTDCSITSGVEETVVTTEEKDHCIVVDSGDGIAAEIIATSQNPVSEDVLVAEAESSEIVHPALSSPCVEHPAVSFCSTQVSIKDVISNSESQSSGSSIFMVTDSVVASDSASLPLVVPVAEDNDSGDRLDLCDSDKIPVAEVTVHDDGSTSYVVRHQEDGDANYTEEINTAEYHPGDQSLDIPSASVAPSSTKLPGKRKRKSSLGAISMAEDTLNVPHLSGWARSAMGLLQRVMKFRGSRRTKSGLGASHWFLQPVTAEEAPGYHQVVRSPMDFSTVKRKLETFCYKDISEFNQDMILIKSNCEMYNPPEHEARLDCEEVFTFYQQEYDRLIEKWQKTHLFSPSQKKPKVGL